MDDYTVHVAPPPPFFFPEGASGNISIPFRCANKDIVCCSEMTDKGPVLKSFLHVKTPHCL